MNLLKRKDASINITELAKSVNTHLFNTSDQYINYKYRQFQTHVKADNAQHVFKRLVDDAQLKSRQNQLRDRVSSARFEV